MTREEKTLTFTIRYNMFAPGERVRPCSSRCSLPPGTYVVKECLPPPGFSSEEDSLVFLEGRPNGVDGRYLTPIEPAEEPDA